MRRSFRALFLPTALVLSCATGAATAETVIASVDQRYEVATKDFGGGVVQMNSRQDSAEGSVYSVHQFDCMNMTYATLYTGDEMPATVPQAYGEADIASFDRDHDVAPLAQHACTKHGHPLTEW